MTLAMLSLVVSVATGLLVVELFWSRPRRGWDDACLKASLAAGLGPGISGMLAFLVTLLAGFSRPALITTDLVVLALVAALVWRRRRRGADAGRKTPPAAPDSIGTERAWGLALLGPFLLLLVAEAVAFGLIATVNPEGAWDAWAFWNLRAKHLVQSPAGEWARVFEAVPGLIGYHPDYPPLFPFLIARAWAWGGTTSPVVTLVVAALFSFSIVGVLVAALSALASRGTGLLAGLVLLGTPTFLRQGAWRLADVPLGWFILATAVLLATTEARGERSRGLLVLAGIACGLAGLTKNEGVLFVAIAAPAWALITWLMSGRETRGRDVLAFALGLALPLALLVYFKAKLAPGVDLLGPEGSQGALPAWSPDKHLAILDAFVKVFFSTEYWCAFPWALVVAAPLLGFRFPSRVRRAALAGAAMVVLMLLGYYAVYATTRHEITWLLATTIFRLLVQVAPLATFVVFLFLRPPEAAWATPADRGQRNRG